MNNTPLFSVLIAQYNNGKFLLETINSVKNQTYDNWEIIIVDDGSTDNSITLYEQLASDERIKIYYNEINKGCGYTKRRCVELATGEICGFLDPDDTLERNALETMVANHVSNNNISIIFSRCYLCDELLSIKEISRAKHIPENYSYLTFGDHSFEHFTSFKKRLYDQTEGINPKLIRCVDQDLNFKMEEVGEFQFLTNILYKYRIHKESLSNAGHYKALFWHMLVIYDACNRRNISSENIANKILSSYLKSQYWRGETAIKNTAEYKVGFYLLFPLRLIKKIVKRLRI